MNRNITRQSLWVWKWLIIRTWSWEMLWRKNLPAHPKGGLSEPVGWILDHLEKVKHDKVRVNLTIRSGWRRLEYDYSEIKHKFDLLLEVFKAWVESLTWNLRDGLENSKKLRKTWTFFSKHQRVVGQLLYRSIKIYFPLNKGRLDT